MADRTDFQFGQGETFKILIHLKDRTNGNIPLNIDGYTFTGQVRENYTTDELAAELELQPVGPSASGSLFVILTPEQTAALTQRKYVYDITMTTDNATRRILEGALTVRPAVTR
jgi:hypothetical protein